MQTCQKPFLVTIDHSVVGPDWSTMSWDLVTAFDGTLAASFATVTGSLFATSIFLNAVAGLYGWLSYTGPACNCRITMNAAYGNQGVAGLQFSVYQNGVERLRVGTGAPWPHPTSGNYDFSLLAGTGSLIEIGGSHAAFQSDVIAVAVDSIGPPVGNGSVDFSFTASNI